jgi:hypothetical protein
MRAAFVLAFLIATTATAVAQTGPVIVIPGRPGVPVMINGVDASYAVVEGDWGLGKGQRVQPTVYGGPVIAIPGRPGVLVMSSGVDASYAGVEGYRGLAKGRRLQPTVYGGGPADYEPHVGHYYPSSGNLPGYGRLEIEPPSNGRPQQAESYHRSWSAQSAPQPAQPAVPFDPPPVIAAPQNHEAGPQNLDHPPQNFQYRKPRKRPQ